MYSLFGVVNKKVKIGEVSPRQGQCLGEVRRMFYTLNRVGGRAGAEDKAEGEA